MHALLVTNSFLDLLSCISSTPSEAPLHVKVGKGPKTIAITPDGLLAYIANIHEASISVVKLGVKDLQLFASIPVEHNPEGIAITPNGKYVYVTNRDSNSISVIETARNVIYKTIRNINTPCRIVIAPDGNKAYITSIDGKSIYVLDLQTNTIVNNLNDFSFPLTNIAISPEGKTLWVVSENSGFLTIIQTDSGEKEEISIDNEDTIFGQIAFNQSGKNAYVVSTSGNKVIVMDVSSRMIIHEIAVGLSPFDIKMSSSGRYAYVSNTESGTISMIDLTSNQVVKTLKEGLHRDVCAIAIEPISPPLNPVVKEEMIDFGFVFKLNYCIKWEQTPSLTLRHYNVYKNGKKVAIVSSDKCFYEDHNLEKSLDIYAITAENFSGEESSPVIVNKTCMSLSE